MRLILLIILFGLSGILAAQQGGTTMSLEQYLEAVAKKYNVHFAFPTQWVNEVKKIYAEPTQNWQAELTSWLDTQGFEMEKLNSDHWMLRKKTPSAASHYITIKTTILDRATQSGIGFVNVYLSDFSASALSDQHGQVVIKIPSEKAHYQVVLSLLGYHEKVVSVSALQDQKAIYLEEKNEELSEVIITCVAPFNDLNGKAGHIAFGKKIQDLNTSSPARGADISSTLLLLPGISAHQDESAGIKIRGGNADETLILLDDLPIYNASHYYGFFNAVNPDYVQEYALYKNNLPVEHQGGISGLVALKSLDKTPDSSSFLIGANSFMATAYGEIKLGAATSLLLSGRSTYGDINIGMGISNTSAIVNGPQNNNSIFNSIIPDYNFNDLHIKFRTNWSKKFSSQIQWFQSADDINANNLFTVRKKDFNDELKTDVLNETLRNSGLSLHHSYQLNPVYSLHLTGYFSNFQWNKINESRIENFSTQPQTFINNQLMKDSLSDLGIKVYIAGSSGSILDKAGIEYHQYETTNFQTYADQTVYQNKIKANLTNAFGSLKFNFGNLIINPGTRISLYETNNTFTPYASPQLNFTYALHATSLIKAASSINHQFLREIAVEDAFGQQLFLSSLSNGSSIPVSRSWNQMLGFNYSKNRLFFDLELWHKATSGATSLMPDEFPVRNKGEMEMGMAGPQKPKPPTYRLLTGERRSFGLDFMVGMKQKNITAWIAYTWSKTRDRYTDFYNSQWFASANDRRHQLKFANELQLGRFNLSFNYIFASGKPYLDYQKTNVGPRGDNQNRDNIKYLSPYHRFDTGLAYRFSVLGTKAQAGISVFNLFNRENLNFIQYNVKLPPQGSGNPSGGSNQNNLAVGSTYGLVQRLVSFDFKIKF